MPPFFALPFGLGDVAFAADDHSTRIDVPRARWRPITGNFEQFTAMGYQVRGIEGDVDLYEAEAIEPNGLWVKALRDPATSWSTE